MLAVPFAHMTCTREVERIQHGVYESMLIIVSSNLGSQIFNLHSFEFICISLH